LKVSSRQLHQLLPMEEIFEAQRALRVALRVELCP
jgi:hypothetical protein